MQQAAGNLVPDRNATCSKRQQDLLLLIMMSMPDMQHLISFDQVRLAQSPFPNSKAQCYLLKSRRICM